MNSMQDLQGKTALVTGSTSGIGLAIARAMAAQGASILLNGFGDDAEIEEIRADMARKNGVAVHYSGADLTRPEEISEMVEMAVGKLGKVDILVNNAGIQHTDRVENFPVERWDSIIALNLSAVFHATRVILPGMRERGWGRIINIASVHGLVGSTTKSAYIAAKHGVVGLTKVVALENADTGITCNAICPGWVLTPLVEKQVEQLVERESITPEQAKQRLLAEKQPSKAFVTPEQIGELAVFLCSAAADEIRGAALPIDGGWTAV